MDTGSPRAPHRRLLPAALLSLLTLLSLAACRDSAPGPTSGSAGAADGLRRYTVRAELVRLPDPAAPRREVALRHEAIDDFADAGGKVVGMGSMVMPFELAPGVQLDGAAVGDEVEVRFAVGWSPPVLRVEQLRRLPAGTALEFRAARPPAGRP
jgi:Cu/Ag efflux protein CusF